MKNTYHPPICKMCSRQESAALFCQKRQESEICKHQSTEEEDAARNRINRVTKLAVAALLGVSMF